MVVPRFAAALVLALALAAGIGSAGSASTPGAPTGLRAFLLRADEPAKREFPRTPAFAWNPVKGAKGYEFVLSTSSSFRESGTVWRCPSAKCPGLETPVAAPGMSLPWITGSPHSLYARVRAVLTDGTKTAWSDSYGFDLVPPAPPRPLASRPGLLRWTPVPEATGYQVWLVDTAASGTPGKIETVFTNVLDERDFYTFHQSKPWIGTVRWRVRALRSDFRSDERVNGVPATQYGAWSPIYRSTNPNPTGGKIKLGTTISDVVTHGGRGDLAHRLMPGFTWTGNQTIGGTKTELYRVYVFTDKQCLNRVFAGSPVGSPAYAARPYGGLGLPSRIGDGRDGYLPDLTSRNAEQLNLTYDGERIATSESKDGAKPTTTLPLAEDANTQSAPFLAVAGDADLGAPVSLWDDEWPRGGYYWTVVGVRPEAIGSAGTTLAASSPKGSTTLVVSGSPGFKVGDQIQLGSGDSSEIVTIQKIVPGAITLTAPTLLAHDSAAPLALLGSGVVYRDLELAQDVCAAGRVARFGVSSEPSLIAGDDPFASGLSPTGQLTSALRTSSFYRAPVVSWTPALRANVYQVQWSRKASPFDPAPGPGDAAGVLTGATSYVLPLTPGTWYYRVRGIDWSLPAGAQGMGWSDVAKIVIENPTIRVVPTRAAKKR